MSAEEVIRKALEEIIHKILLSTQRRMEQMEKPEQRIGEYAALHTWSTRQLQETSVWLASVVVEGKDTILAKINGMTAMERLQMYQQELARREAKERVAENDRPR
jgi:hypothetical protein